MLVTTILEILGFAMILIPVVPHQHQVHQHPPVVFMIVILEIAVPILLMEFARILATLNLVITNHIITPILQELPHIQVQLLS